MNLGDGPEPLVGGGVVVCLYSLSAWDYKLGKKNRSWKTGFIVVLKTGSENRFLLINRFQTGLE